MILSPSHVIVLFPSHVMILSGQSIINEQSVCITSSNLDVITHICLSLDESYLYHLGS